MTGSKISSIEEAYRLADIRSDEGDQEAFSAISFCAATAQERMRWIETLSWACLESSAAKRKNILERVLMEMENADEDTAKMPMRAYLRK